MVSNVTIEVQVIKMPIKHLKRRPFGASFIALILSIAFFAVLPLSLFGFEMARAFLMQQQLTAVTDAATLAGTAALTGLQQSQSLTTLQTNSMTVAAQNFEQNSILQTNLTSSNVQVNYNTATLSAPTQPGQAVVNITLLDATGNAQATGSDKVVSMRVQAIFTDNTIFHTFSDCFKISPTITVSSTSNGGLPQVDMVLCFDISGSMDDATNVYFINRVWSGNGQATGAGGAGTVTYTQVAPSAAHPVESIADVVGAPEQGTTLDVMPPQQLSNPYFAAANSSTSNDFQYNFCENLRANMSLSVGTPVLESGCPPGNYDPNNPGNSFNGSITATEGGATTTFTDMVVQFPNYPYVYTDPSNNTWTFSGYADEVEASRGNLELASTFSNSQGGNTSNSSVQAQPKAGWYTAYWQAVSSVAEPISAARQAANAFFQIMNSSTNGHFGLVTFADTIGTTTTSFYQPGGVTTYDNISQAYNPASPYASANYVNGGTSTFPLPLVSLNQNSSNFSTIMDITSPIPTMTAGPLPLGPTGGTNIYAALNEAVSELTNASDVRPQARRVIVLFTDGIPTEPTSLANGITQALAVASTANQNSIPIYTIGLAQVQALDTNPSAANLVTEEGTVLGDNLNGSGKGIAYTAGNGSFYVSVNNFTQLDQAFQTIARSLVSLQ